MLKRRPGFANIKTELGVIWGMPDGYIQALHAWSEPAMGNALTVVSISMAVMMLVMSPSLGQAKQKRDRVASDFNYADMDGDRKLSRAEWNRRGNFERLDKNADGYLTLKEVRALYKGHDDKDYDWPPKGMPTPAIETDLSVKADRVGHEALDKETLCGIGREMGCDIIHQKKRGLIATGTGPRFPKNAKCPSIDDFWAMDYGHKRNRQSYHGGIDLPVPWGTPMRAVAAGSVVAKYEAHQSKRGTELVLRHSPEQTGLPMWTYSAYGHMDAMADLEIGQRVEMGQIIGPTGNSGISAKGRKGSGQSTTRRPAIHLAIFYSDTNTYSEANDTIIPVDGYWLDPMAFYRHKGPFDSPSVKALPEVEKDVPIPVLFVDGTTFPADTKLVWPYACQGD
jgi:murein DD-endopeptidase MepM/ murein hydrolase activator NlpD